MRAWGSQTGVSWRGPPWFGGPGWSALTQKVVLNGARGLKTKEGSLYRGLVLPRERCPLLQQATPPTAPRVPWPVTWTPQSVDFPQALALSKFPPNPLSCPLRGTRPINKRWGHTTTGDPNVPMPQEEGPRPARGGAGGAAGGSGGGTVTTVRCRAASRLPTVRCSSTTTHREDPSISSPRTAPGRPQGLVLGGTRGKAQRRW